MQANEAGGWVIDPSNPNRATYTDEDGEVYEAFRDEAPATPEAQKANVIEFGDSTEASNTSIKNDAIDKASILDQMLADTRYTDQDIRNWVAQQPGSFGRIEENLAARRRGEKIGRTTVEPFIKPNLKPVIPEGGRDFTQRLKDSYNEAVQYGFPGLAARKLFDWTDQMMPEIKARFPGQTDEWYEQMQEEMISQAQRSLRQEYAAIQKADPAWKDEGSFYDNVLNNDRFLPYIAGQVFGSVGPETLVQPGGSAALRIGTQAALGAGSDLVYQGLDVADNVRDEISGAEALAAGAAGAGFQGLMEAPGALARLGKRMAPDAPSTDPLRAIPETLDEPSNPYQAEARKLYDDPSSTRADFDALADRMGVPRQDIQLDAGLGSRNEKNAVTLFPEAEGKRLNPERSDFAVRHIDELTKDWQNRPQYEVHESFDNLPDVDSDAIGVVTPDGKVMINMKNVDSLQTLNAVTFHEGLGHYGLSQKFGDDLDLTLDEIYQNSSGQFKQDVDDWVASNPREYQGPDQVTRATEEVLAEMSEAGRIPVTVLNRLRNVVKQYGRDIGIDLKYTDREIKTILGMAHDATINGMKNDVIGNGFRYSKAWHGSPYQFEKFSNGENANSGDGGNLFGYGTYVSDSKELANAYKPEGGSLYEVDIPDGRWLEWERPIKDQPEVRQALEDAGMYEPHMSRMTAGEAYNEAAFFNGPREVSEALSKSGFTGNKYIDNPGSPDPVTNYVVFKEDDAKIVNRYMKKKQGSVDPDNIRNVRDLDYFLSRSREIATENDPEFGRTVSREETEEMAKSLGLTPSRLAKGKSEEGLAARIDAGMQVLVNQLGKVEKISARMVDAPPSQQGRLHLQMNKEMALLAAVYGKVSGNNSEVGRALNILNKMRSVTGTADDVLKYMKDNGNDLLSDPENFQKFMKVLQGQGPSGQAKLIRAAFKPKAEDYVFRLWYNMMLSAPATHTTNFMGNGLNFMYDLLENTGAAIIGQGKRFGNADRVRGREVMYRMYGALNALRDSRTWTESGKSFMTGKTGGQANSKTGGSNVYQGNDTLLKGASMVLEGPTRALAAGDEWWRNVMQLSNIYGLSVRNAGNKGLKGSAFWSEVDNLINNPTPEMISATNDYTKVLQFLDKPSALGKLLIDAQTPKPNSSMLGRGARATLRLAVPFVRTPDALIRTAIRRSGALSAFERENIKGWKAGGAERDQVLARVAMGSALGFYVASQVAAGNITGLGPSDYKKKAEWMGSHQENSVKVGGKWYSIAGLEPVSTNVTTIATLAERLRSNEISQEDYAKAIITPIHTIAASLSETSYLQGFQDLMEITSSDPRKAETALTNFLANTAASATTPAIVRSYTQSQDETIRDTTGDGTFGDRVEGRIKSATPGLSETLPERYDVFGRLRKRDIAGPDMATRINQREEETDPVVLEVQRLGDKVKEVVLGAPSKSGIKVNGEKRKLTAEEFSRYQHLSGYWITESIRQEMQGEEWSRLSDGEKYALIRDITKDMRKAARDVLFDPDDEEE